MPWKWPILPIKFATFVTPTDQTWFEVLKRNGLFRTDPDPYVEASDPLAIPEPVVRFSFQRFQDHLIAEALLEDVRDIHLALAPNGVLAFIHNNSEVEWEWRGLLEALSIQVPERHGIELVDALPEGADRWWQVWYIRDAFAESVRWREKIAFNDRTLELLNSLSGTAVDQLELLLELSVSVDHPWNAEFLHRNLISRELTKRDRSWTTWVNGASINEQDPVGRLIDWALSGLASNAERLTQRLCSIMLCWFFTSSNRHVRDSATKALTRVLVACGDLLPELCALFADVDDIYVTERLPASAFGACCIDPSASRLQLYAKHAFKLVFEDREPHNEPHLSLLVRDYARGIIEFAFMKSQLPSDVMLERSRPPYCSSPAQLNVSDESLNQTANKAGTRRFCIHV